MSLENSLGTNTVLQSIYRAYNSPHQFSLVKKPPEHRVPRNVFAHNRTDIIAPIINTSDYIKNIYSV